eukprot:3913417-Amphidinium_carterae.1
MQNLEQNPSNKKQLLVQIGFSGVFHELLQSHHVGYSRERPWCENGTNRIILNVKVLIYCLVVLLDFEDV